MPKNTCSCLLELPCLSVFPSTYYVCVYLIYACHVRVLLLRVLSVKLNLYLA